MKIEAPISQPLVYALGVQLVATSAVGLVWLMLASPPLLMLAVAHGALAACFATALGQRWWWRVIHASFAPLLYGALQLAPPPALSLAAFALLALVFGGITRTRVPLFLSSPQCVRVLAEMLEELPQPRVADLGCGTGGVLSRLGRHRPDAHLTGFELAPAGWLISLWRTRTQPGTVIRRSDFMHETWVDYDLVYVFLSPLAMNDVGRKARDEMRPGALLVSNSFAIEALQPVAILELPDRRHTHLYVYRPGADGAVHEHDKWPIPRAFRATAEGMARG